MELGVTATTKRNIDSTTQWDKYFPETLGSDPIINGDVSAEQTANYMRKIVAETWADTAKLAPHLKGRDLNETCSNIWHFIYQHIQYELDKSGTEQLRRPARSWKDRFTGVDCDCYSIFAGSILYNLGIPFKFRITKYYGRPNYQHVYVIVPNGYGHYTVDPVIDNYNQEKEFTQKKDFTMNNNLHGLGGIPLQYLNGIAGNADIKDTMSVVMGEDLKGFGGLGSVQDDLNSLKTYLIRTREVVAKNPALVASVIDGLSFVKMIDKAIQYWDTPQRDAVLNELAKIESKLEATGNYKLSFKGLDEVTGIGGWVVDKNYTGTEAEDPEYDYQYLEGFGAWSLAQDPEFEIEEFEYRTLKGLTGEVTEMRPRMRAYRPSLGGFFKKIKQGAKAAVKKVGNAAKKVAKVMIKFNPLSITIRLGILAAMKVNMFKMADRLKYGYLTKEQAQGLDMDLEEWQEAVDRLKKVEKLFADTLQGSRSKLKDAILWGKRKKNFNQRISEAEMKEIDNAEFNEEELSKKQAAEMEGLLGLGSAAAAGATAAAATPFLTRIWTWVKEINITGLFKRNPEKQALIDQYGPEEGKRRWKELKAQRKAEKKALKKGGAFLKNAVETGQDVIAETNIDNGGGQEVTDTNTSANVNQNSGMLNLGSMSMGKKVLIGAVAAGALYLGYRMLKKKKSSGLSGVKRRKKSKKSLNGIEGLGGTSRKAITAGKKTRTTKRKNAGKSTTSKTTKTKAKARKTTTRRKKVSSIKLK